MTQLMTPPTAELADRLAAYREARDRGVRWLLRHMNRDGSIGDPATGFSYYRAPWTFTVVGETEAALAICGWIRRNLVTPDGRIDGPYRVFDEWSTYRDATLVVGAQLALQHDLSFGLWPGLLALRDPRSGPLRQRPTARRRMEPVAGRDRRRARLRIRRACRGRHPDGHARSARSSIGSGMPSRRCPTASITPGRGSGRRSSRSAIPSSTRRSCCSTGPLDASAVLVLGRDRRRVPVPALPRRATAGVPRPRPPLHGLHDRLERRAVQLAGGVQGLVGRVTALAADRRRALRGIRPSHGRVVRGRPGARRPVASAGRGDARRRDRDHARVRHASRHADRRRCHRAARSTPAP